MNLKPARGAADLIGASARLRGRLKHSWIENQVLNKSTSDILALRQDGVWEALENQFSRRIGEALSLTEELIDGYSPAQLVDRLGVFAHLSENRRAMIKALIHTAYLAHTDLSACAQSVERATQALSVAFDRVRCLWRFGSDAELSAAWEAALASATQLRGELEALPKRIVLP